MNQEVRLCEVGPRDGLQMANGMMAGFFGRTVCFCEPYRPHAWPEKYQVTVDSDIVALAAVGTTLFILTKGAPHWAQGSSPDAMSPNSVSNT